MIITDILSSDILKIPAHRDGIINQSERALPNYVFNYLSKYISLLKEIDNFKIKGEYEFQGKPNNEFLVEIVEKFSLGIRKAIIRYLEGSATNAYAALTESFLYNSHNVFKLLFDIRLYDFGDEKYYRLFRNSINASISKELLFHTPYELVEKVKNQRFSISGFPCLYLGSNVFTCAKELDFDKKEFDLREILVSQFKVATDRNNILHIELLDLTIKRNFLFRKYLVDKDSDLESLFLYLLVFPIVFSSSLKVSMPDEPFKPEYIIPQLLLQWVRNEKMVDGIKYSSSKISDSNTADFDKYYNIVLPPREVSFSGQCSYLKGQLFQTEPKTFSECLGTPNQYMEKIDLNISQKVEEFINKPNNIIYLNAE